MSGAPGEGVEDAEVPDLDAEFNALTARAEAAEGKLTALQEHIDAGTLATQAVRIAALEAEHAEMAAALRKIAAYDDRGQRLDVDARFGQVLDVAHAALARIQGEAPSLAKQLNDAGLARSEADAQRAIDSAQAAYGPAAARIQGEAP